MIVVARGGGSVEDLLPFSDEAPDPGRAARRTPVVSAIGHEQDPPLLDLVADVRASTPTDAAKRVVPDVAEELRRVLQARDRLPVALSAAGSTASRPGSPRCGPAPRWPTRDPDRRPAEGSTRCRERARRDLPHRAGPGYDDSDTCAPGAGLSPLATLRRGYAVLSGRRRARRSPRVADARARATTSRIRVADGRIGATTTTRRPRST